jgi:hypothetical protein
MADILEADWRHFRRLHPVALDRYCRRVLDEAAARTAAEGQTAHERYLALYQLVRDRNREMAEVFDDVRRSTARIQLLRIRALGLVTPEELAGFSADLRTWLDNLPADVL